MDINDREKKTLVATGGSGGVSLPSVSSSSRLSDPERARACSEPRAKNPYSDEFEAAWKLYGRKEEKVKAYARWKIEAKAAGGEGVLRDLVAAALAWQGPIWARDGWTFAKYFERYLKARKWEDEPRQPVPDRRRASSRSDGNIDELANWRPREKTA